MVYFYLYPDVGDFITYITWRFSIWACFISECIPDGNLHGFSVTPPTGVEKTWEVTVTPTDMKIKCNTLEVLHFIFENGVLSSCKAHVKGKKASKVAFSSDDTATKNV